jgi:hypothetical protein
MQPGVDQLAQFPSGEIIDFMRLTKAIGPKGQCGALKMSVCASLENVPCALHRNIICFCHVGKALRLRYATSMSDVRLENINYSSFEERLRIPSMVQALSKGDWDTCLCC